MEDPVTVSKATKASVFVGIFLVRILDGIPWLWGNLSVYITSYYYANGDEHSAAQINWVMSLDMIGFNLGVLAGGTIVRRTGVPITLVVSLVTYNAGILLSYFAVQRSVWHLCVSCGLVPGFSSGIIQICQLTLIVQWTNRYHGLSTASVPSSNIVSAVVMNIILTLYINPTNYRPDVTKGHLDLFSQQDLIERVPYAFLLFGCLSLALGVIGFALIREDPGKDTLVVEAIKRFTKWSSNCILCQNRKEGGQSSSSQGGYTSFPRDRIEHSSEGFRPEPNTQDTTPLQALKRREFYALWIFVAVQTYAFYIINTYYKAFGLLYIPDDRFLTMVVMAKCLCTPPCTWLGGLAVDKFGLKVMMVVFSAVFCVVSSVLYVTASNRWLYLVTCVLFGCTLFTIFCLTSSCCLKLFGQSYFTTIFGMTSTPAIVFAVFMAPLTKWIITTYGWFPMFSSVGFLALINVIVLVLVLPENTLV